MTSINFKNKDGLILMSFSNLSFYYSSIKRVCFEIDVNFDFFKAKTQVESERFDFEELINGLKKIYQREWTSIVFSPIERNFIMQFDLQNTGQIRVHSKLSNHMFTGNLDFEFITDQSFVPDLIQEIETALKENIV